MEPIYPDVEVQLTGKDGNAFAVLARTKAAIRKKHGNEAAEKFQDEAVKGDYDDLLGTCMKYVNVA